MGIKAAVRLKPLAQDEQGAYRVLVAEDDQANSMVALELLSLLGYEADHVTSGIEAIERVKSGRYSIVLMDMHIHGMDGLEATRRIREYEKQSGVNPTAILCLTASALPGDREKCLSAGMNDYLSKPFRMEDFETKLAVLMAPSI